ncbi:WD40/YVTN/BNR-like repeat-containing protein [Massilia consociata]|uniref:WD40/YVTN/BNR-like repeat-containing protein n=1 Tax=Massilia consociata TaxID=760117 RepID=A0ABV6FLW2_9BURK
MHHTSRSAGLALACTVLLAACGGGPDDESAGRAPEPPAATRIDLLSSASRGMESVVFRGQDAYVSLGNTALEGTAVLRAGLPLTSASTWTPVAMGGCALGPADEFFPPRAPRLKLLADTLWLFQPWSDGPQPRAQEHSTCAMSAQAGSFAPRDQGLRACNEYYCSTLSMNALKLSGSRLYSNAGAGINLFASSDQGASWRVLRGGFDEFVCTHTQFQVIGDRVLVGGECPLDHAFLEAYQLSADGMRLVSEDKLPITTPELENRNIQFIEPVPDTQRVFVGVEGGLLRSEDGGRSFKFVIHNPVEGATAYPYVKAFLPLRGKPDTLVVGGFDKHNFRPYMAWSKDGGTTWTDISSMLPGYTRTANGADTRVAVVTSIAEDPQGRILFTMNEREDQQGRLFQLTMGRR